MQIPTPVAATGTHFYKYSSLTRPEQLEWLREIILKHRLYLPTLDQLNDPADGGPLLAPLSNEKMFEFLFSATRNTTLTSQAQERGMRVLRFNIEHHSPATLQREVSTILNRHLQSYRIYSLSKRWNNISLWAKYADDHRGYCLEFLNTGEMFHDHTFKVQYGEAVPMDITDPKQRTGYFLFCKRPEWKNEEKVRLIRLRGSPGTANIQPEWLARIILGEKILTDHEKANRNWLS
jgi:hypothetical protein